MMRKPSSEAVRLSVFYAAVFSVIGTHMPFWPVWLESRGLDAVQIGIVVAIGIAAKVVVNPLAAHIADRRGERRRLILLLATGAIGAFALFDLAQGFWSILAVTVLFFGTWSAVMPLGESLTMLIAGDGRLDYGRVRLWGSLSFIAAAVLAGQLLSDRPVGLLYWLILGFLAVLAVVAALLPGRRAPSHAGGWPLGAVLGDRRFLLFLAAGALIQGSHGVYYAFSTLHWKSVGYSEALIGWLWAEGVIAEVLLFTVGSAALRRLGPLRLLMLGGLAAGLRWTVTGTTDALPVLVVVQALHAFTFGAAHLGAIHFISRAISPGLSATAQSLYSATVMGLGLGAAVFASGELYDRFGPGAYYVMAGAGLAGGLLALILARRTPAATAQ